MNPIAIEMLEEFGFSTDKYGCIFDQDTRQDILFDTKRIKIDDGTGQRGTSIDLYFDIDKNMSILSALFDHFCTKVSEEEEIEIISTNIYNDAKDKEKTYLSVIIEGGITLETNAYNHNALKYIDMAKQLNNYGYYDKSHTTQLLNLDIQ